MCSRFPGRSTGPEQAPDIPPQIEQYGVLTAEHAEKDTFQTRQRLEDVTYTLCVSTATREIDKAPIVARRQLPRRRRADARL